MNYMYNQHQVHGVKFLMCRDIQFTWHPFYTHSYNFPWWLVSSIYLNLSRVKFTGICASNWKFEISKVRKKFRVLDLTLRDLKFNEIKVRDITNHLNMWKDTSLSVDVGNHQEYWPHKRLYLYCCPSPSSSDNRWNRLLQII